MIYFVFEMDKSSKSKSKPVKRWPAEFKPRFKKNQQNNFRQTILNDVARTRCLNSQTRARKFASATGSG